MIDQVEAAELEFEMARQVFPVVQQVCGPEGNVISPNYLIKLEEIRTKQGSDLRAAITVRSKK